MNIKNCFNCSVPLHPHHIKKLSDHDRCKESSLSLNSQQALNAMRNVGYNPKVVFFKFTTLNYMLYSVVIIGFFGVLTVAIEEQEVGCGSGIKENSDQSGN